MVYTEFIDSTYDSCDKYASNEVCYGQKGEDVLDVLGTIMPLFSSNNKLAADLGCLLLIAAVCKLGYIANLVMISKKASKVIAAK